jgi:pullulanase
MQKLALSIILTSQGISFLHAGSEFLRSKNGDENSFNSGDSVNAIDWELKSKNHDVFEYVKALIEMRKQHPAFRMKTAEKIQANIEFEENLPAGVVAYMIDGAAVNDQWRKIKVYYNGNGVQKVIPLPSKNWTSAILGNVVVKREHMESFIILEPYSCSVIYKKLP